MKRRGFIRTSTMAGGGLMLSFHSFAISENRNSMMNIPVNKAKQDSMISKQVEEVSNWWKKLSETASKFSSLDETRDFIENWQALTAEPGNVDFYETKANGVDVMWIEPHGCEKSRVLLCIHGGGFFTGSIYTHRKLFAHFAKQVGCRALSVNYRRAPEHQHPAQVNDTVTVYGWLLQQGIKPKHIALLGDSAGGGLSVTTLLLARDKGLPMPAATMPFCAWFDMEVQGESAISNRTKDHAFTKEGIVGIAGMVLGESGNRKDPYINPLYADLKGLPPLYLQVGDQELLLDDSTRLARLAKKAGVEVKLDIFPNMQHTWHMTAGRAPEANDAIERYAKWVKPKLGL
jgi:epsilon-lactone hydrolase